MPYRPSPRYLLALGGLFVLMLLPMRRGQAAPLPQTLPPESQVQSFLEQLSPAERVGQLFLVNFSGLDISEESQIYDLITNQHIGGVVLKTENDNFIGPPGTIEAAWILNRDIQLVEWRSAQATNVDEITGESFRPVFIPLFIGISQEGGGYPYDQILSGLTPLPNAMALGATWEPDIAYQVGEVVGRELSALGFNLLFGPSLDVQVSPNPESQGIAGTRSFGGDPYWVGQMGQAYVEGVYQGSGNRLSTIGIHFPGLGGSDRPPEEEIPVVRKSLTQLEQIELAPFFAVTGDAPNNAAVDGLLLSHIHYQGLQGNIRAITKPVSFDPQALEELLSLEPFSTWREQRGLIISDELGTRAVRRFFDPTEQNFTAALARTAAREALLAGNDVLNLGNITATGDPDSYTTILNILEFFIQKYNDDVAFAQRVDEAVFRILSLKFSMYGSFTPDSILPSEEALESIVPDDEIAFQIGRQAATLLSPAPVDLDNVLPVPPGLGTQVTFFSDTFSASQCSQCPVLDIFPTNSLLQAVNRLYGPQAGGQVLVENLASYSFSDLEVFLDDQGTLSPLLTRIINSQWLVFTMLNPDPERPASDALQRFLAERPDLFQDKNLIVFAIDAPYYLDATEISKITVYYGLYSTGPQFVDVAARLLFKELTTSGASPVSISGLGYDLIIVTSPDPDVVIPLFIISSEQAAADPQGTPDPEEVQEFQVGDLVTLRTGEILDYNRNRVPDNTPVRISITTTVEGTTNQREIDLTTVNGMAQTNLIIENSGTLSIVASSGQPAALSETLQFEIASGEELQPTPTFIGSPEASLEAPVTEPSGPDAEPTPAQTTFGDWVLIILVAGFVSIFAYQVGATGGQIRWAIRWALTAFAGGMLVNLYLAFDLPGSTRLLETAQVWGVVVAAFLGALVGWGVGWLWKTLAD